jgi:hypothetical protein
MSTVKRTNQKRGTSRSPATSLEFGSRLCPELPARVSDSSGWPPARIQDSDDWSALTTPGRTGVRRAPDAPSPRRGLGLGTDHDGSRGQTRAVHLRTPPESRAFSRFRSVGRPAECGNGDAFEFGLR